jgi:hypothetical protein
LFFMAGRPHPRVGPPPKPTSPTAQIDSALKRPTSSASRPVGAHRRWDPYYHPLNRLWRAGDLEPEHKLCYFEQHRYAALALAERARAAAACAPAGLDVRLDTHARRQLAIADLWDRLVDAIGGNLTTPATTETRACMRVWSGRAQPGCLPLIVGLCVVQDLHRATWEANLARLDASSGRGRAGLSQLLILHLATAHEALRPIPERLGLHAVIAEKHPLARESEAVLRAGWALLDGVLRNG